ncbi:MAG: DUF1538 domain-containing protein [Ruminococcaceae bacterium]|nr:DUF1538 domain-containing protein [Oscillospiraceae bacterium]
MARILWSKIREALVSVLPVALIVVLLNLTPLVDFTQRELVVFSVSALFLILGIGLFNMGADLAMTPMGEQVGSGLTRNRKMRILLSVSFIMGVIITVAEPDLSVLATQVKDAMNGTVLIWAVGIGVGIFLLFSVLKMVFRQNLSRMLMFFYMMLFALASLVVINGNADFLALAYDSGGVTTGPITVPFIMALGVGIASTLGGKDSAENSFGSIALCSVGPILAVMALGISLTGEIQYKVPGYSIEEGLGENFFPTILHTMEEVANALGMIILIFAVLQLIFLKLPWRRLVRIAVGIVYTFLGLVIFLVSVTIGFMPIGYRIGTELANGNKWLLLLFGFLIGMVVVLAEPAVHVLNRQVEEVTGGTVTRKSMMTALSLGVGISILLSMLRIVYDFSILYYLIPGYFISLGLSFFVPKIYTAIAFDSGGVASGPLTSGFILPMAIGACMVLQGEGKILSDGFGIVAMVAMTPLITIQTLGFRAIVTRRMRAKAAMRRILQKDDGQIIRFM